MSFARRFKCRYFFLLFFEMHTLVKGELITQCYMSYFNIFFHIIYMHCVHFLHLRIFHDTNTSETFEKIIFIDSELPNLESPCIML